MLIHTGLHGFGHQGGSLDGLRKRQQRAYDLYHLQMEEYLTTYPDETPDSYQEQLALDQIGNKTHLPPDSEHIAYWDIETMGLDARYHPLMCVTIQSGDGKVYTKSRLDFPDDTDKSLLRWTRNRLERYHTIVGYNSKSFDAAYTNFRLKSHNRMRPIDVTKHVDAMYLVPRDWPKRSLDYVSRRLGLQDETASKSGYDDVIWRAAYDGDADSMAYIVKHNVNDVELTRRVYVELVRMRDGTE